MPQKRGLFITFEGCEGSGKSTQSKLLHEWLNNQNINSVLTREPGGTKTAEKIREILLNPDIKLENSSQLLLHCASRIEHVYDVIEPSLKNNCHVICDRFLDSTISYQHYGHGLNLELINNIHKVLLNNIMPDLTFVLDIDAKTLSERLQKRQGASDRYERLDKEFHTKVINGFREIAKSDPKRCYLINSSNALNDTHNKIIKKIQEYLV